MSQHDGVIADAAGAAFLADLNNVLQAFITQHSGTSDPATLVALQRFARTDLGVIKRRNAANNANILDDTLAETIVVAKSGTFTAGLADFKRVFACTGTWSLVFAAAATLGDGWWCAVKNEGAGVITLDPDAAELVDGAATLALAAGQSCIVYSNGAALKTVGVLGITQTAADARYRTLEAVVTTNWDNALNNSLYYSAPAATNSPDAAHYVIGSVEALYNGANTWVTQTACVFTEDASTDTLIYRRECNNTVWGSWYRLRQSEGELDLRYMRAVSLAAGASYMHVPVYAAQTIALYREHTSDAYVEMFNCRILRTGTFRCAFKQRTSNAGAPSYARIYKNGVAVGTIRSSTSTTYADATTEDIAFVIGDTVQLFAAAYDASGSYTVGVANFRLGVTHGSLAAEMPWVTPLMLGDR